MADGPPASDPSKTPAGPSIRIVHVTDIHFGDADPERLDAAHRAIEALSPDCVALTGDLTQAGRKREFLQAGDWLKKVKPPIVAAPGNHDAPVYTLHKRVFDPFGRYRNLGLADFWSGKEGLAAIASVNTARAMQFRRDWSQGVFNVEHVSEAQAKLENAAPTGWRFLACHHPPFTPTEAQVESRTRRSAQALALLKPAERSVVLCGHVHGFFMMEDEISGVRIVAAPSLASSRERGAGAGFVVIDVTPKALAVQRWRHQGDAFAPEAAVSTLAAA